MQIEHVTNAETVIGTNYRKTENASGGITTREYSPILGKKNKFLISFNKLY